MGKAKKLKERPENCPLKNVYIQKDISPMMQNKAKALRDQAKIEREKPENAGCNIKIDYKESTILRNEIVIFKSGQDF